MLFNSIPFLLLFALTYCIYWISAQKWRKYILLLSSIVFYSYNSPYLMLHFGAVIAVNYLFAEQLLKRKLAGQDTGSLIRLNILLNLANLFLFKYFYFFCDMAYILTGKNEAVREFSTFIHIALPLAISFYTFQIIAYQVDIHRGKILNSISFTDYSVFILFFPQLIAGPIMRSEEFLPLLEKPVYSEDYVKNGILLILTGLLKKVVIADTVSGIINPVFSAHNEYSGPALFLATLGFAIQVYSDFSGYSDMARGLAFLLGFDIPVNFRGPFLSQSFTELWSRWHITLSTWLRDYLYIPLGGNRDGHSGRNMMITMSLGGLWHGANISFFLWGFYLGLLLYIERVFVQFRKKEGEPAVKKFSIFRAVPVFITFSLSGVFFRTGILGINSVTVCYEFYLRMFSFSSGKMVYRHEELIFYILFGYFLNWLEYSETALSGLRKFREILIPVYSVCILLLLGLFGDGGGDFIYFQF